MQVLIIIVIFLGYLFLLIQYNISAARGAKDLAEALSECNSLKVLNQRTYKTTLVVIGCIVLYSVRSQNNFLQFGWNENFVAETILLFIVCFLISIGSASHFGMITRTAISIREKILYFTLRISGLIIYEIFFRGVLLGIFLEWFPIPIAIVLNIILYAAAHAFGSQKEFVGSIPFGFLLCSITVLNQSVYPSVLLHLLLALPYEIMLFGKCQLLTKKLES
jgi:membrane protease YdiL (CAAX protease family)